MKNNLLVLLFFLTTLVPINVMHAVSDMPTIMALAETVNRGGSAQGVFTPLFFGIGFVAGGVRLLPMLETALIATNIAISLKTKKATSAILKNIALLTHVAEENFATVKTKLGDIKHSIIEQGIKNSNAHQKTQQDIEKLRQNIEIIDKKVDIGFKKQLIKLKSIQKRLDKTASKKDIRMLNRKLKEFLEAIKNRPAGERSYKQEKSNALTQLLREVFTPKK